MESVPFEVFCSIVWAGGPISLNSFIALSYCSKTINSRCKRFIAESGVLSRGYPLRDGVSLLEAFKCYCGRRGWHVRYQCGCFIKCSHCKRPRPERLMISIDGREFCGFPCESLCGICGELITKRNSYQFSFANGYLRCNSHHDKQPQSIPYCVWYRGGIRQIQSLFASNGELFGANCGTIQWDKIAEYDPDHPILFVLPKSLGTPPAQLGTMEPKRSHRVGRPTRVQN